MLVFDLSTPSNIFWKQLRFSFPLRNIWSVLWRPFCAQWIHFLHSFNSNFISSIWLSTLCQSIRFCMWVFLGISTTVLMHVEADVLWQLQYFLRLLQVLALQMYVTHLEWSIWCKVESVLELIDRYTNTLQARSDDRLNTHIEWEINSISLMDYTTVFGLICKLVWRIQKFLHDHASPFWDFGILWRNLFLQIVASIKSTCCHNRWLPFQRSWKL